MFIDYYQILEISESATIDEIKSAFRKQAIKWHPDRNPNLDTTFIMQKINEAYLILKDPEARRKYDLEYQKFKSFCKEKSKLHVSYQSESEKFYQKSDFKDEEYIIQDDILNSWIKNAKRQSIELSKQTIEDFKGTLLWGVAGFFAGIRYLSLYAVLGYILLDLIVCLISKLKK